MIENLLHTVSKDKTGLHGADKAANFHSKGENVLEGQFRALFQSFHSGSDNPEKTFPDQDMLKNTDDTELNIKKSQIELVNSESDTENDQTADRKQTQAEGKSKLPGELAQKLNLEKDEADLVENREESNSVNKPVYNKHELTGRSLVMEVGRLSQTGGRMATTNNDVTSATQDDESQKMIYNDSEILSIKGSVEKFDSVPDDRSANEKLTNVSAAESELEKKGLAGQYIKNSSDFKTKLESTYTYGEQKDFESAEKLKNPTLNSESNTKAEENLKNEIPDRAKVDSSNKIVVTDASRKFNQEDNREAEEINRDLNVNVKSEGSYRSDKGKSPDIASNQTDSKKNGQGSVVSNESGTFTVRPESGVLNEAGSTTKVQGSVVSNESGTFTVRPESGVLNEAGKVSSGKESARLSESGINSEQGSNNGFIKTGLSEVQSQQVLFTSGREQREPQTAAPLSGETVMDRGMNRQEPDSGNEQVRRFVYGNIESAVGSTQKPVESSVLIQDKIQPKRERNDLSFINSETAESSRLSIPGFGEARTIQNIPNSFGELNNKSGSFSDSEQNEIFWKEHTTEMDETNELNRSELSISALSKLGDSTLTNHFLRRVLLPSLTQSVLTASGQSNRTENWQRHNFVLEDGSKVQLSARKVDGVLQIKLGSSIAELSKLLHLHQDEIREHIEKEYNIQIELQFENGPEDQEQSSLENFFGEEGKKQALVNGIEVGLQDKRGAKQKINEVVARKFGYNGKEWTA